MPLPRPQALSPQLPPPCLPQKPDTVRSATAGARVLLGPEVFALVAGNQVKKGDVLTVAQLAGAALRGRVREEWGSCEWDEGWVGASLPLLPQQGDACTETGICLLWKGLAITQHSCRRAAPVMGAKRGEHPPTPRQLQA